MTPSASGAARTRDVDSPAGVREIGSLDRVAGGAAVTEYRVGTGFDAHAFEDGVPLVLGGVRIDHPRGLAGHSDGDVLAHALTDAVLGAAGLEDIGALFSVRRPGARGRRLGRPARARVGARPRRRLGARERRRRADRRGAAARAAPRRDAARGSAAALGVAPELVAVRATTTDGLGFTGRREGLAAQAVALLRR